MSSTEWLLLKHLIEEAAVALELLSVALTGALTKKSQIQRALQRTEEALKNSTIYALPSMVVAWLLSLGRMTSSVARWAISNRVGNVVFGGTAGAAWLMLPNARFPTFARYTVLIGIGFFFVSWCLRTVKKFKRTALFSFFLYELLILATVIGFFLAVIDAIPHANQLRDYVLISFVAVPLAIVFSQCTNDIGDTIYDIRFGKPRTSLHEDSIKGAFFLGLGLSVAVTLICIWLGNLADPSSTHIPTNQLVSANLFFDSATVAFTYWVLTRLPLPIAVALDIAVSAAFAVGSVWLGTLGSGYQLSLSQCARILFALSPDYEGFYIGGLFWVLHSTFLPTVIYLLVILVALTAKYVALFLQTFVKRIASSEFSAIGTAAFTCLIFIAVLHAVGLVVDSRLENAQRSEHALNSQSTASELPMTRSWGDRVG